jgi:hypothetical protein
MNARRRVNHLTVDLWSAYRAADYMGIDFHEAIRTAKRSVNDTTRTSPNAGNTGVIGREADQIG